MPELKQELRENLDITDVNLYDRIRDDIRLTKDSILDGIAKGDRFADPFRVLDTDYDTYLVTYQCREEFRKATETDYVLQEIEKYRVMIENYNSTEHDQYLANRAQNEHHENVEFDKFQMAVAGADNEDKLITDEELNKEIDMLMQIDNAHHVLFSKKRPTIEEWRERRKKYLNYDTDSTSNVEDYLDENEPNWYNTLAITLHLRQPNGMDPEHIQKIKDRVEKMVPGFDFKSFHMETYHGADKCLDEDIFNHSNAVRFSEITKVKRVDPYTEKDMQNGNFKSDGSYVDHLEIDGDEEEDDEPNEDVEDPDYEKEDL